MNIDVSTQSAVPSYEQIRSQITRAVLTGALAPGSRLPTIRQLAGDLSLATNTVARAYRELESDRIITTLGKKGSFVAEALSATATERTREERRQTLLAAAATYAMTAHSLGYQLDLAVDELRSAMTRADGASAGTAPARTE
jgi:DNA-binding transcriptional regulator YhcF (GntR family)